MHACRRGAAGDRISSPNDGAAAPRLCGSPTRTTPTPFLAEVAVAAKARSWTQVPVLPPLADFAGMRRSWTRVQVLPVRRGRRHHRPCSIRPSAPVRPSMVAGGTRGRILRRSRARVAAGAIGINGRPLANDEVLRRSILDLRGRSRALVVVQRGAGRYHVAIPLA